MIEGIDLSEHQDFTPDLSGLGFVVCRASIGTRKDYRYDMHAANVRAAGLLLGAYHYNWNSLPVSDQVDAFLRTAGDVDFYFIDVESNETIPEGFTQAQTAEFIRQMQATGRPCGLYHSQSGYFAAGQSYDWVAKWSSTPPGIPWTFWQYQGFPLDRNRFDGDLLALQALSYIAAPDSGTEGSMAGPNITALGSWSGRVTIGANVQAIRADGAFVPLAEGSQYSGVLVGEMDYATVQGQIYGINPGDVLHYVLQRESVGVRDPDPQPPTPVLPTLNSTTSADGQTVTVSIAQR